MFRAVNTESEYEKKRSLSERLKIHDFYLFSLKSSNIDRFLSFNVVFDQNQQLFNTAKSNLFFSLVYKNKVENLLELSKKYNFLELKQSFFAFVRICLDEKKFIQAKKLLNLSKKRGWFCNEYFTLNQEIKVKCDLKEVNINFEDFL